MRTFQSDSTVRTTAYEITITWAVLALMYAIYRTIRHIAQWSWSYYQRAQVLL